jgi:hypothetical protein
MCLDTLEASQPSQQADEIAQEQVAAATAAADRQEQNPLQISSIVKLAAAANEQDVQQLEQRLWSLLVSCVKAAVLQHRLGPDVRAGSPDDRAQAAAGCNVDVVGVYHVAAA